MHVPSKSLRNAAALLMALGLSVAPAVALAVDTPRTLNYLQTQKSQDGQALGSIGLQDLVASTYPSAYRVANYGAKCDGKIIYSGATVVADSPTISVPGYAFTATDIGSIVNISIPSFNGHTDRPLTSFSSTIVDVSGGNATMAANSTFSSSGAGVRWYHTVDTAAIQAALDAGAGAGVPGGAVIEFPPGVCVTGKLTFYSGERIVGSSIAGSIVMLANGSNSDLFVGQNFATLTGSNSPGGVHDFAFQNIQLDGNRGANTASGSGAAIGTGNGIRVYGYQFTADNLMLNNFAGDGWYSEWSNTAGNPIDSNNNMAPAGMEPHIHNVRVFYNAGYGMVFSGAHDAQMSYLWFSGNGAGGLVNNGLGSPLSISQFHSYQNGGYDLEARAPYLKCTGCYIEGSLLVNSFNQTYTDSNIGTMVLGVSGGPAVYGLKMMNDVVTTINNVTGSTFNDNWLMGSVGSVTGTAYVPQGVFFTTGLNNSLRDMRLINGPSYPVIVQTDAASRFSMSNGGSTFAMDGGGNSHLNGNLSIGLMPLNLNTGTIGLNKVTASNAAPGAAGGKLELVCGTKVGTAKLQVYAGTSTTPSLVINNIGGGVSGC